MKNAKLHNATKSRAATIAFSKQAPGLTNRQTRALNSKSTATEVQLAKLAALLSARPHHTHELRQRGISHPAGRIQDLEQQGYVFSSDRITTVDGDGFTHRNVALYTLLQSPEQGGAAC